jgi:hypothetical protein
MEDPRQPQFRTLLSAPNCVFPRIEKWDPKRTYFLIDKELPKRRKSYSDASHASRITTCPAMEKLEPRRLIPRSDMPEPIFKFENRLVSSPTFTILSTLKEDPSRTQPRIETEVPTCDASNTLKALPSRIAPKMDKQLPMRP